VRVDPWGFEDISENKSILRKEFNLSIYIYIGIYINEQNEAQLHIFVKIYNLISTSTKIYNALSSLTASNFNIWLTCLYTFMTTLK
jgi:hypothetical protein